MEIDPRLQLIMFLGAFSSGVALCGLFQLLQAVKILVGAYAPPAFMEARYARPLPLLHRGVPFGHTGAGGRLWKGVVSGILDCLFCVIFAAAQILLLYAYNDGAFRLSVPVLAIFGFALLRFLAVRALLKPMAYFAYGFAALMLYLGALLALPAKGVRRFLWCPAVSCYRRIIYLFAIKCSARLCTLQLQWAERGLEGECPHRPRKKRKERMRHVKKEIRGKDNAHTVADPHPHSGDLRGGADHWCQPTHGVESAPRTGGGASRGKGCPDRGRPGHRKLSRHV